MEMPAIEERPGDAGARIRPEMPEGLLDRPSPSHSQVFVHERAEPRTFAAFKRVLEEKVFRADEEVAAALPEHAVLRLPDRVHGFSEVLRHVEAVMDDGGGRLLLPGI